MTRLKLSALLLGATALTLPMGTTAFAQQAQQAQQAQAQQGRHAQGQQAQQDQQAQAQQTQQSQQAAAQQETELGACERLSRLLDEASGEKLLAEFEGAQEAAEGDDPEACEQIVAQIEQAGGISEEAVAEGRGVQFLTDTKTFSERERITETVQIEQEAIVEGEVLVRQPIPEIAVEQPGPQIGVAPGPVDLEIQEQAAEIVIRQAPANVRVEIPEPTITIEQPAPEIVLHMPPPGVSLDQQPPKVTVELPDPTVTVAQADPTVTANVEARFVDDNELAQIEQRGDEPLVTTVTERLDAAGNPVGEQQHAEVTVQKGEPEVQVQQSEQQPEVRFQRAEPRVTLEQAEPNVEVAFAESAKVQVQQIGEPTVRIERGDQQQASAEGQPQAMQGAQQATQGQQQAAGQAQQQATQGQQQASAEGQSTQDQAAVQQGQADRLSVEDTNRLLAMPEDAQLGESKLMDIQAGDLRGADVVTIEGEEVGEIDQITSSGDRLYAVIEHGGFLGIGEDHVAIPLERIAMQGDQIILLGLTEEELEQMANYDFEADQAFSANDKIEIGRFE